MKLRAKFPYSYGTRALKAGDVFTADDKDGELIVQMGSAERLPDDYGKRKQPQAAAQPAANKQDEPEQPQAAPAPKKGTRRRGYLRRDERAQD